MDLFVLDTAGDQELFEKEDATQVFKRKRTIIDEGTDFKRATDDDETTKSKQKETPAFRKDLSDFVKTALASYSEKTTKKSKKANDYDDFASSMGWSECGPSKKNQQPAATSSFPIDDAFVRTNVDELKSNTLRAIEKRDKIEKPSARQLAKMKKAEREKTKGKNWFNIPAPELTEELENDMKVLQMRSVLDPKHFYKRNSVKVLPKYFQVGTVKHSPLDHYSERGERRNKKRSLVDELLADAAFQKYNKRKYKEVIEQRKKSGYHKANQKMRKLKKKKK